MADTNRKTVYVNQGSVDLDSLDLKDALVTVQQLIDQHGEDARLVYVDDVYSDSRSLHVVSQRPETDEEMAQRIQNETLVEQRCEAREREAYQRLHAKFGS
jgi:hypothetical protein